MRKLSPLFALLLFMASLHVCVQEQRSVEASVMQQGQQDRTASAATSSNEMKIFRGTVAGSPVQMKLRRNGETLSGTYFYEKIRTNLTLKGTIDRQGNLTMQEFDSSGKHTGTFKGKWSDSEAEAVATIEGSWSKPGDDQSPAFLLYEQPIKFTGGLQLVSKEIKDEIKKIGYTADAEYPQIIGARSANVGKFNQHIKALVTGKIGEFKKNILGQGPEELKFGSSDDISIGYSVDIATNNLVSVDFYIQTFNRGAAHPLHYTEVVNYDLKSGKLLKLADLFKPGSNYLQTISRYCIDDLKKQKEENGGDIASIKEGASAKPENYERWNITRKGLVITFNEYQVGPYVEGAKTVLVPYTALKGVIKPQSPVSPFVG